MRKNKVSTEVKQRKELLSFLCSICKKMRNISLLQKKNGLKYWGWDAPLYFNPVFREMEYWGVVTSVYLRIKVITPYSYIIYFPAKNQATNPITPITIAAMLRAIKPQTATPPNTTATTTNMAARISPCPVSSMGRILLHLCSHQAILLRGESSRTALTNSPLKSDMDKEGAHTLTGDVASLSSYRSSSLCISFIVRKKQVPSPIRSQVCVFPSMRDGWRDVFSVSILDVVYVDNLTTTSTMVEWFLSLFIFCVGVCPLKEKFDSLTTLIFSLGNSHQNNTLVQ